MAGMRRRSVCAGLLAFGAAIAASVTAEGQSGSQGRPAPGTKPPLPAPPGALPPLPPVSFEPVRPMPIVQQVYEFAGRHPDVLSYIPCYCGCEHVGHTSNHDCFVKSRAPSGRVIEWDTHGIGCAVCLDVGRRAMTLFHQGMPVAAIRAAIDHEYSARFHSHTPTPPAPAAAKS